jgi:hypothetical protein
MDEAPEVIEEQEPEAVEPEPEAVEPEAVELEPEAVEPEEPIGEPWDVSALPDMPDAITRFDLTFDELMVGLAMQPNPDASALAWSRKVIEDPTQRLKIADRAARLARGMEGFREAARLGIAPKDIDARHYHAACMVLLRLHGPTTPAGVVR